MSDSEDEYVSHLTDGCMGVHHHHPLFELNVGMRFNFGWSKTPTPPQLVDFMCEISRGNFADADYKYPNREAWGSLFVGCRGGMPSMQSPVELYIAVQYCRTFVRVVGGKPIVYEYNTDDVLGDKRQADLTTTKMREYKSMKIINEKGKPTPVIPWYIESMYAFHYRDTNTRMVDQQLEGQLDPATRALSMLSMTQRFLKKCVEQPEARDCTNICGARKKIEDFGVCLTVFWPSLPRQERNGQGYRDIVELATTLQEEGAVEFSTYNNTKKQSKAIFVEALGGIDNFKALFQIKVRLFFFASFFV